MAKKYTIGIRFETDDEHTLGIMIRNMKSTLPYMVDNVEVTGYEIIEHIEELISGGEDAQAED